MDYFDVTTLSAEKLLENWRWLCPNNLRLVATNSFGDLFLEDVHGSILMLDVVTGSLNQISESLESFKTAAVNKEPQEKWFFSEHKNSLEQNHFHLGANQCFAYKILPIFQESATIPDNIYVANLYEYISFLGDLHQQIKDVPNGEKVRLNIGKRPER